MAKINYKGKANEQKYFIVFDGTSHYAEMGMDVEQDIEEFGDDIEVVEGPFDKWDDNLDARVEQLNDEAYGTHMYR